jgi:DNA-directed RNA polymerase subunit RPC12/RpoP
MMKQHSKSSPEGSVVGRWIRRQRAEGRSAMDAPKIESLTSGTMAGAGSFRCQRCGYVLNLAASDALSDCPGCGGKDFVRASLFTIGRPQPPLEDVSPRSAPDRSAWLAEARAQVQAEGAHLLYEQDGELIVVPLDREWTRIGRSLTADVRFDDPTVSRRHALVVRHPDGVRVLDDRSLNGVFVNGERVEWRALQDGDEILVGRYRISFVDVLAGELGERTDRSLPAAG